MNKLASLRGKFPVSLPRVQIDESLKKFLKEKHIFTIYLSNPRAQVKTFMAFSTFIYMNISRN